MAAYRRFERNPAGRDFVVGDVHGMFGALRALLARAGFDEERDRLFSVGDLIDRGPGSREALDWLRRPWLHAVRGNHEQFLLDSGDPRVLDVWVYGNGGEWWLECGPAEREAFREACAALPIALEVETSGGRVGVVHADAPRSNSWPDFVERLERGDARAIQHALWSRERISGARRRAGPVRRLLGAAAGAGREERVLGVDLVLCGHTPLVYCGDGPMPPFVEVGNVRFIDTAAVYAERVEDARLTMVEIEPECGRVQAVATAAWAA